MHVALARPLPCEKETKTATQRASPRFAFACGSTTGVVAVSRLDEGGRNELARSLMSHHPGAAGDPLLLVRLRN